MGDMFVDQILMLETLSASLPKDWIIYVKEHPMQWVRIGTEYSSSRYRGYYQKIAKIKNVQLIPTTIDSYVLMDAAQATATVAGAPGWESILHGKPAIIFGNPWYAQCPGVFRVHDVDSSRRAIAAIASGFTIPEDLIATFLKSFDDATIHGFIAASNATAAGMTRKENMESITNFVCAELKRWSH